MQENSILVVGSLNMDQVVHVPHIPRLGETLLGAGSLRLIPGGKGANQAVAMARLHAPVSMAGRVGNDPFGAQLMSSLQTNGVVAELIVVDELEMTGTAFIFLTPDGDNAIVVASGANMQVGQDQEQMRRISEALVSARALVLQLEIPLETVKTLIVAGHDRNVPVVLNLAPARSLPWEILEQVDILIVNESEASLLSGQRVESREDAYIVATVLREHGISTVVITLGAQGALLAHNDGMGGTNIVYQDAPKVQVVDTTAAGDCFAAALTVALTEGQTPQDALRFAVCAGSLKVTKFGAQTGLPGRAEVEAMLRAS